MFLCFNFCLMSTLHLLINCSVYKGKFVPSKNSNAIITKHEWQSISIVEFPDYIMKFKPSIL